MRRTLLVSLAPAAVVAAAWVRLESPLDRPERIAAVALLAVAAALPRTVWARGAAVVCAAVGATWIAFGDAPDHPLRFVHEGASGFANGFLDFYDVRVPFDPRVHAEMRGVVVLAVFGFAVAVALAIAARRAVLAAVLLLVAAGWPATLRGPSGAFLVGSSLLVAVLVVLAGLTTRHVPRAVVPAAAALVLLGVGASTSAAVAKGGIVSWQHWDPYNAPQPPVSVSFVWNADYSGLRWPSRRTTVLEVKAPPRSLYWRAAVLDRFSDDRWNETTPLRADALVPAQGKRLLRQEVKVLALSDTRLVGASVPLRFDAGDAPVRSPLPGIAFVETGLTRGFRYTAWSYAPQPTPGALARSAPDYPIELVEPGTFLDVAPNVPAPVFGTANREQRLVTLLDRADVGRYVPLARAAFGVAGRARTPYAAASALERWFRVSGGFRYTNTPAMDPTAPLVGFVTQTRSGYCQHFAGAMALMLRYLGVPARVAVGFSSGTYDDARGVWRVTDRDAHAWVEVWFRGYGWLPFDPTPAGRPERGQLSAPYAAAQLARARGGSDTPTFGGPASNPRQGAHRHGETEGSGVKIFASSGRSSGGAWRSSLLLSLLMLAGAAAVGIAATKLAARRARYLTRDPRRLAAACRQELADYLLDQRIDAARSATLHELGALVRHELSVDPDAFVSAATAARFGPPAGAPSAARRARRELRALLRAMRVRLRARDRARGLLSLRSLGFAP
ncbi:MAG TPA: transglutaminaseTgpA domain-containing protein [Gaiellaceae bacterium]|nr:transglutaminaseTgpA domain-containing protein [Gaiellaceae bacterium]